MPSTMCLEEEPKTCGEEQEGYNRERGRGGRREGRWKRKGGRCGSDKHRDRQDVVSRLDEPYPEAWVYS